MITSLAFIAYPVKDIAEARAFYEGTLGLKLETNWEDQWLEYDVAGTAFAIHAFSEWGAAGANGGLAAFEVADLDGFIAQLKQKNVRFVRELIDTPVCRMAVISDPAGNHLVIHQRKAA